VAHRAEQALAHRQVQSDPEPARRPADLADHLRESRPADLSQYTAAPRIPRTRPPADDDRPGPPRRPATLADHLSARQAPEDPPPPHDDPADQDETPR
jgi:RND superfamily putative drug exporter